MPSKNPKIKKWPCEDGRFKLGNLKSSVAVCTNASVNEIELDMEKIAIAGSCVTENIGVEKIVKNLIANPRIRFLINVGRKSKGHFVEDAFDNLYKNGLDKSNRIIGAKGNMPILKKLSKEEVEAFRKQIMPINLIGESDPKIINNKVMECLSANKASGGKGVVKANSKITKIKGEKMVIPNFQKANCIVLNGKNSGKGSIDQTKTKDKIEMDPKGYFRVELNKAKKEIILTHYNASNKLDHKITGKKAARIYSAILKKSLIGKFKQEKQHAKYIESELSKAEKAIKHNLNYIQDEPLKLEEKKEKIKAADADDDWFD